MDKKPIGYKSGEKYFMDKKPIKNPKYSNVKGTINSGMTVDKIEIISNNNVTKRRGELFSRIHKSSLVKLIGIEKYSESIYDLDVNRKVDLIEANDLMSENCSIEN